MLLIKTGVCWLSILSSITFHELQEVESNYYRVLKAYWHQQNYLTARWWFLVALSVIPAVIWWLMVDKKRLTEITAFGLFYGVAAIILDSIGSSMMAWTYTVRISPYITPELYPYDVGIVIVPFMLIYQKWGRTIKTFFISAGILSAFIAFIAEPSMRLIGIYEPITWKHSYSFPIYWLLALICWWIIYRFKKMEHKI